MEIDVNFDTVLANPKTDKRIREKIILIVGDSELQRKYENVTNVEAQRLLDEIRKRN